MADQEQLDRLLKQGVHAWNEWRGEHNNIEPELSEADLSRADLSGADLSRADLSGADLRLTHLSGADLNEANLNGAHLGGADLRGAKLSKANLSSADHIGVTLRIDLSGADLSGADLSGARLPEADLRTADLRAADLRTADLLFANLSWAHLTGANLSWAHLTGANLSGADLNGANLNEADLNGANLNEADLTNTTIGWTSLGNVDLSMVKGLETVTHRARSYVDIHTLTRSHSNIPDAFLKGIGAPDTFIDYIHSLVSTPIHFYSCFISYSSKDEAFANRLYADLQTNNVRCWFAPEDLKWGAHIRTDIDEAIRIHDKLLLILSKSSVASGWVEHEVKIALAREQKEKKTVLFPVRIDKAIFESPYDWATEIRHERNIGNFTRWKDHDKYQKVLARLLHDLKASS
jgi:uncharacterized protein YjbI with pentapeptide repeats